MGPGFEDALVDALGLREIAALVSGNSREQDVMVAALDHVDGVDLDVAELIHGCSHRGWPVAERLPGVEPLCLQPGAAGILARDMDRSGWRAQHGLTLAGFACRKESAGIQACVLTATRSTTAASAASKT